MIDLEYPKNKKEWWNNVDKAWVDILSILHRFIGMNDCENVDGEITLEPRSVEIEKMKKDKNPKIFLYFNAAWGNAPDVIGLDEIPGWTVLCDLCSEVYVLGN